MLMMSSFVWNCVCVIVKFVLDVVVFVVVGKLFEVVYYLCVSIVEFCVKVGLVK